MKGKKITFLGGGNISTSIAMGLHRSACINSADITLVRRNLEPLRNISKLHGFLVSDDIYSSISKSNILILALPASQVKPVLHNVKEILNSKKHMMFSVVAGLSDRELTDYTGNKIPLARAMPSIASSVNQSMTCISGSNKIGIEAAEKLFQLVGKTAIIDESLMDASTIMNGCGTAFVFRFIRALCQAGVEIGLKPDLTKTMVTQTVNGAAMMLFNQHIHPEEGIDKVTTGGGITIKTLNAMEEGGLSSNIVKSIRLSNDKLKQINIKK